MPRPFWKGYLKLSLVTCPVAMTPAVSESDKLRFHTLNRATGNRIEARLVDATTGTPVAEADQVSGYETEADNYVVFEDEELSSVALESTRTIDIERFVPHRTVAWLWYDTPHYLFPDGPVGEEAFSVIREAMAATETVGISRLVLYRREHAILLKPRDRGMVLWTLRYGGELRSPELYPSPSPEASPGPAPEMVALFADLIDRRTADWDPKMVADPVQERLREIVEARKKSRKLAKPKTPRARPEATENNVIDIMAALRKSLAGESKPKKRR